MQNAKILVIEDDCKVRKLLQRLLSRAGYQVSEAGDGQEGIHSFRNNPTDLIITDLIMPGKEGLETIIDLRREFPKLRIIAISGGGIDGQDSYLNAAKLCGADMTFRKPFDTKKFLDAIGGLLAKD